MLGMLGGVGGGGGGMSGSGGDATATATSSSDVRLNQGGDTSAGLRGFNMEVAFPGAATDPTKRVVNDPTGLTPSMFIYGALGLVALIVVGKMLKG